MSLHDKIMNIPLEPGCSPAYDAGHRDARHAAAEIALQGDEAIDRLNRAGDVGLHRRGVLMTLLPCPLCGSEPKPLDWTGVMECYGHAWQTAHIYCAAKGSDKHCTHNVAFDTDSDATANCGDKIEAALVQAWNALAKAMAKDAP
jgi:hypothetical protein